ncbi:MAG: DUF4162 domain-containing protein, partial [Candidatus Hydrogenedens sp.]|nr:DUF4162 domain-containing protein [Candidatus Hydrogenedens sp.]
LFSSHLLDEVERVADDVCMIHHGHVVLNGGLDQIKSQYHMFGIRPKNGDLQLNNIPGVIRVSKMGHKYQVMYEGSEDKGKEEIQKKGGDIIDITTPSLEDIFIAYVKKQDKELNHEI